MKQHTLNSKTLIAVPVPEDAINFAFGFDTPNWLYYYLKSYTNSFDHRHIVLPPGSYTILGRGRDIDETTWRGLVDKEWDGTHHWFPDYTNKERMCLSATQSGHSFLKSEGISPDDLILIKK